MRLKTFLWKIFGRIVGFSVLTTLGLTAILQAVFVKNTLRNCYMPGFTETILSGIALLIALCSATLFLVHLPTVRASTFRKALAFAFLPLAASLYLGSFWVEETPSTVEVLHLLALFGPVWFWIGNGYFQFRKNRHFFPENKE